jgi:hypothetical protein
MVGATFAPRLARAHTPITTKILFDKEVIRMLQANCLGCHHPAGIASMSFASYKEARPWAKDIEYEILRRKMPPWSPVPGYGVFENSPRLSQRDVDVLLSWVEGGAPEGDPKDLPPDPLYSNTWQLGPPDTILRLPVPVTIKPGDDYEQSFALSLPINVKRWIRALDLRPGNGSVVHCAEFFLESTEPQAGKSRAVLGTWIPGQKPVPLPDGLGRPVNPRDQIVVRIHYVGREQAVEEQSEIGVYFTANAPQSDIKTVEVRDRSENILQDGPYSRSRSARSLVEDGYVVGLLPRSSRTVKSMEVNAVRADGIEETLVWILASPYDWQPVYYYKHPVFLPKGTRIEVTTYLDYSMGKNSDTGGPETRTPGVANNNVVCTLFLAGRVPVDHGAAWPVNAR